MANGASPLDTTIEVVTPENIAFQFRVAGPFRRFMAYSLDLLVRGLIMFIAYLIFSFLIVPMMFAGVLGFGVMGMILLWFGLSWFYGGLLETFWNGQTVGKRLMGLRVLSYDGQPINALQAIMRNILRSIDAAPVAFIALPLFGDWIHIPVACYVVGLCAAAANDRYQRLGDIACGTIVAVEERSWLRGLPQINEPLAIRLASELPAALDIPRSLAKALAAYVERRRFFSPGRRADIARHVGEPLREEFRLPPDTSHDLLLCAMYYRAFFADQAEADAAVVHDAIVEAAVVPEPAFPAPIGGPPARELPQVQTAPVSSRYGGR